MPNFPSLSLLALLSVSPSYGFAFGLKSPDDTSTTGLFSLWSEAGAAFQSRNDVEIPKGDATRIALTDLGKGPLLAGRIYAGWDIGDHGFRLLAAPLTIKLKGEFSKNARFQGKTFAANKELEATYRFDSYRATYRYRIFHSEEADLFVGFTGKIRDAEIGLKQGSQEAKRSNVGFVPLLHLAGQYRFTESFGFLMDADALASPYGRAEDVALLFTARFFDGVEGRIGYRTVEGGSDGGSGDGKSKVYSFTWLHAIVVGLSLTAE